MKVRIYLKSGNKVDIRCSDFTAKWDGAKYTEYTKWGEAKDSTWIHIAPGQIEGFKILSFWSMLRN